MIRPFQPRDADQVVALWNTCLPYDPVSLEKLRQLCQSPHYDPAGVYVAELGDKIVGYLPAMAHQDGRYADTGWILSLAVDRVVPLGVLQDHRGADHTNPRAVERDAYANRIGDD